MRILCYGDSNTYGYDGDELFGGRFAEDSRWPELLGRMLGCECLNCGLNGRRVPRFQRSLEADLALLRRFGPWDLLIVMLGTNDLLSGTEPEDTAEHMRRFLTACRQAAPESAVLLCAPPPAALPDEDFGPAFEELAAAYETLARELGVLYADTAPWRIETGSDGVHFTARGHRSFAMRMGQTLCALLSGPTD